MNEATDKTETPAEKFARLGNSRLTKALDAISLLAPLSVRATYEYSEEQVDIIMSELDDAVENVRAAFENGGPTIKERKFF